MQPSLADFLGNIWHFSSQLEKPKAFIKLRNKICAQTRILSLKRSMT
jgi:hypothetical protein